MFQSPLFDDLEDDTALEPQRRAAQSTPAPQYYIEVLQPPPHEPVRLSISHQVLGLDQAPLSLEDLIEDLLSKVWKLEREMKTQIKRNFGLRRQLERYTGGESERR
jgi:hypothetical protein